MSKFLWSLLVLQFFINAKLSQAESCKEGTFSCGEREMCFPSGWKCDGENDCPDGSDELNCDEGKVPELSLPDGPCDAERELNCEDGSNTCVPLGVLCDNVRNCPNGRDEVSEYCLSTETPKPPSSIQPCPFGEDENGCIPPTYSKETLKCISECLGISKEPECKETTPEIVIPQIVNLITTTPPPPPSPVLTCSKNMDLVCGKCIYMNIAPPLNWTGARQYCQDNGMRLMKFDANCFIKIIKFFKMAGLKAYTFWCGANDRKQEGNWTWEHSPDLVVMGTPVWQVTKTMEGFIQQPQGKLTENCGALENCPSHYLNDRSCHESLGFICEKEADLVFQYQ